MPSVKSFSVKGNDLVIHDPSNLVKGSPRDPRFLNVFKKIIKGERTLHQIPHIAEHQQSLVLIIIYLVSNLVQDSLGVFVRSSHTLAVYHVPISYKFEPATLSPAVFADCRPHPAVKLLSSVLWSRVFWKCFVHLSQLFEQLNPHSF